MAVILVSLPYHNGEESILEAPPKSGRPFPKNRIPPLTFEETMHFHGLVRSLSWLGKGLFGIEDVPILRHGPKAINAESSLPKKSSPFS